MLDNRYDSFLDAVFPDKTAKARSENSQTKSVTVTGSTGSSSVSIINPRQYCDCNTTPLATVVNRIIGLR